MLARLTLWLCSLGDTRDRGYQGSLNASHLNGTHPVFLFFFWGGGAISSCSDVCQVPSLKLKASLHLKIDGWNTRPSFLGVWGLFSG